MIVGVFISGNLHRGTRWRVDSGGLTDRELEGMCEDTRHEIYTVSGSQSSIPYVVFGVVYCTCAWVFPGGIVDVFLGTRLSFI
jgi:hypothetical protein